VRSIRRQFKSEGSISRQGSLPGHASTGSRTRRLPCQATPGRHNADAPPRKGVLKKAPSLEEKALQAFAPLKKASPSTSRCW